MQCNIDATKLQKLRDELSFMDREVYNAGEQLDSIENIEIVSLERILDEQSKLIHSLKTEKEAFERHSHLLDAQNKQLIEELDTQVKVSEQLQKTLDKRERVTELKQRMAQAKNEVTTRTPIRGHQSYTSSAI